MINKKNLWFLTLFSLILVLIVYYITIPSELLLTNSSNYINSTTNNVDATNAEIDIVESTVISALKAEDDEEHLKQLDSLKLILMNKESSVDEKNKAFDDMKDLNINKSEEENIENLIKNELSLESFVKIQNDKIKIVIAGASHDSTLANKIMRLVQNEFENKMYITVEFK